jgi:hypothetical protein
MRVIHFYNNSEDTLRYVARNSVGDSASHIVPPGGSSYGDYYPYTYFFASYTMNNELVTSFPSSEEVTANAEIYTQIDDVYYRIVGAPTAEETDYDDAWMMMTGDQDVAVIQIDKVYNGVNYDSAMAHNWLPQVEEILDGTDLMEPLYKLDNQGYSFKVIRPMSGIPDKAPDEDITFLMMPFPHGAALTNEMITKYISDMW